MMSSRRVWRCGVSAVFFLAFALPCCAWAISPEEFERLPKDRQKAVLVEAVERNLKRYENIAMKTTTRSFAADVDGKTKEVVKRIEDYGTDAFDFRRMGRSYRLAMVTHRPTVKLPTRRLTCHYNADTGVTRALGLDRISDDKDQPHAAITTEEEGYRNACRYGSYLGTNFSAVPVCNDLPFWLQHRETMRVRGVDRQAGVVETQFPYHLKDFGDNGTYTAWFDLNKDCLLVRRAWECNPGVLGRHTYQRLDTYEIKKFDGVWLPTRLTETVYSPSKSPEPYNGSVYDVTAEDIKIGGVKPVDLEVVFLAGTLVRNLITGEKWTVGKSGEKLPYNRIVGGTPLRKADAK